MTGRVFITGDKHGTFLPFFGLAEKMALYESDVLIIAGDAGYVWNEDYPYAVETLEQIFPGIIAFIDGNHENHALLNGMQIKEWNGGKVHQVGKRVYHLIRGEIYSIHGNNIFVFGGARSNDKDRREQGISWWKEEEPSLKEIVYGRKQLLVHIDEIDYVITHETPLCARDAISRKKPLEQDYPLPEIFDSWYEMLADVPRFKKWYFGHMHVDQVINERLRAVHYNILLLGSEKQLRWS